jgi:hypothetical protein
VEGIEFHVKVTEALTERGFFQFPLMGYPSLVLLDLSSSVRGIIEEMNNPKIFENHVEMRNAGEMDRLVVNLLLQHPFEQAFEIATMILQRFIAFSMMERNCTEDVRDSYLHIANAEMSYAATHEAAHIYVHRMGEEQSEKREVLAHLATMAYDGGCLSFDAPVEYPPLRSIREKMYQRMPGRNEMERLEAYLMLDHVRMAEIAREILDEQCKTSFGTRHEQIVDVPKLQEVSKHRFLRASHIPLLEALRHSPKIPA